MTDVNNTFVKVFEGECSNCDRTVSQALKGAKASWVWCGECGKAIPVTGSVPK